MTRKRPSAKTRRGVGGFKVKGVVQGVARRGEEIALFEHAGDMGGAAHEVVGEADPGGRLMRQAFGGAAGGGDGAAGVAAFGKLLGGGLERGKGRQPLAGRRHAASIGAGMADGLYCCHPGSSPSPCTKPRYTRRMA